MNARMRKHRAAGGFTLMEVMVVVAIIVILAGITVAVGIALKRKGSDALTETTLTTLDNAMAVFLKNNPEPTDANWYTALMAYPDSADILKNQGVKTNANGVQDGYGTNIHYIPSVAGPMPKPGYFWSYGPDGKTGTANGMDYSGDDVFSKGTAAQ